MSERHVASIIVADRGAKALYERFTKVETWDRLGEGGRDLWRDMFRVAIEAIREPTEGMLSAAAGALKAYIDALPPEVKARTNKPGGYVLADIKTKHRVRYQAMIDECLK